MTHRKTHTSAHVPTHTLDILPKNGVAQGITGVQDASVVSEVQ